VTSAITVSTALSGVFGAACLLLLAAGSAKLADPSRTAGALAALGWPSSPWLVRAGAGAEAVLGAAGLVVGGVVVATAVAATYAGFALFVALALRAGTPLGTCGCFAEADTPPSLRHLAVDMALAAGALLAAAAAADAPVPLVDAPAAAWVLAVALGGAAYRVLTHRSVSAHARSGD
jgi:hypothetical protein